MIPFGEFKPDAADFANDGSTVAKNVVPNTTGDYGPLPALASASDALTARCQGAVGARDKAGNVYNFAGDATDLYRMSAGSWTAISRSAGYTVAATDAWEFAQFKETIIASNGITDPMQSYLMGTSTIFGNLSTSNSAPSARHIAMIDPGFIMAGNTVDPTDGAVPNRVWWSEFGVPSSWPTPGTADAEAKQSDYNDMPNGGWVQKIVGGIGGAAGAVFMDNSVYRIDYEGPPTVFRFTEVEKARGTPAPNSVINLGSFAAYLGEDGFYIFDGATSTTIGAGKVDSTLISDIDQSYYTSVWGAPDPINHTFYWVYPGAGSTSGIPNKELSFNWKTGRWAQAEFDSELIFSSFGVGYTLEGLDSLGYTLDTLPASLDSRAWAGGRPNLSGGRPPAAVRPGLRADAASPA
jgi:hypothetical protein